MKLRLFSFLMAASAILFTACSNGNQSTDSSSSSTAKDTVTATDKSEASNDATAENNNTATTPMKEIVDHYLHVKNALANDNGTEAANGAKALIASLEKIDASTFTTEQKKIYDDVAADLKEMAQHTAENADKIDHQREHFIMMSDDVLELVKGFGSSRTLYVDHCPMANNNKGANWISETEEIRNPYMGKKMPTCGKIEKIIK